MPRPKPTDFDAILADQGQYAWRLIVRILGDDGHDADDCFQQAFVELASRISGSNDVRDIGSLLRRIAVARAIDVVRRRVRDRHRMQDTNVELVATRKDDEPDAHAETGEMLDDLRVALSELPEQQSAAFVLTQIESIPRQDAASAIGVSLNHLAVLLHRARTSLSNRLNSHRPWRARP